MTEEKESFSLLLHRRERLGMLPFLVSRGGWPEACVLIGRGGSGVDRSRRSRAVSGRSIADCEGVRGVQRTHCRVHVAGIAWLLRRGSATWFCVLRLWGRGWRTPDRGVGGPASLVGACPSIGSVGAGLRGPRQLSMHRRPRGCGPWWGCPRRASQPLACSQALGLGPGAAPLPGCPSIVPLRWHPVEARRKLGWVLPRGGRCHGVAPGTSVCCALTGVHWPGQAVAVNILGPPVARISHTSGVRAVWQGFPRPGEVVGAALLPLRMSVGIWER